MNQQEFKKESLKGIEEIGQGALRMINSLEGIIRSSHAKMDKDSAIKLAEAMKACQLDDRVKNFANQIKDLKKDLI